MNVIFNNYYVNPSCVLDFELKAPPQKKKITKKPAKNPQKTTQANAVVFMCSHFMHLWPQTEAFVACSRDDY